MRQWVHCFTLTHKGFITNLAKTYLKSKGLKLDTWFKGIKDGSRLDILGLFLSCVIMGTRCCVHTRAGIWTTLFEEPSTHQELIQRCNLHLGYLGCGIYVEFIPRTETVLFEYLVYSNQLVSTWTQNQSPWVPSQLTKKELCVHY